MANSYSVVSVMSNEKSRKQEQGPGVPAEQVFADICSCFLLLPAALLSAFASAPFYLARSMDSLVDDRIALVGNCRGTGDRHVQLLCDVEIDFRNAFTIDNGTRCVKIVSINLTG